MTEYKTASDLGIAQRDFDDLLATRAILAAPALPSGFVFNMMHFVVGVNDQQGHTCGTACCIAGTMMMLRAKVKPDVDDLREDRVRHRMMDPSADVNTSGPMSSLFYPSEVDRPWEDITPAEGVRAIDNFLTGNVEEPWSFIQGE